LARGLAAFLYDHDGQPVDPVTRRLNADARVDFLGIEEDCRIEVHEKTRLRISAHPSGKHVGVHSASYNNSGPKKSIPIMDAPLQIHTVNISWLEVTNIFASAQHWAI